MARKAIKIRYEKMAEEDGADVKQLAKEQSREVEELEESYVGKKSQLESLNFDDFIRNKVGFGIYDINSSISDRSIVFTI